MFFMKILPSALLFHFCVLYGKNSNDRSWKRRTTTMKEIPRKTFGCSIRSLTSLQHVACALFVLKSCSFMSFSHYNVRACLLRKRLEEIWRALCGRAKMVRIFLCVIISFRKLTIYWHFYGKSLCSTLVSYFSKDLVTKHFCLYRVCVWSPRGSLLWHKNLFYIYWENLSFDVRI